MDEDDADQYDFSRQLENVVGRIYTGSLRKGEQYYLRTLLLHVPDTTSFQYLRTFEGIVYPTYREERLRRGPLSDSVE